MCQITSKTAVAGIGNLHLIFWKFYTILSNGVCFVWGFVQNLTTSYTYITMPITLTNWAASRCLGMDSGGETESSKRVISGHVISPTQIVLCDSGSGTAASWFVVGF